MSESSDTGQNSIVFLGRESFRMQVVGGADAEMGAIPTAFWEGPTARLVERRAAGRRSTDQRSEDRRRATDVADTATPQAPAPARNMIIGISLLAFACGIALATAANRMARTANVRIAQIERNQASTPAAPAAIIVQPLAQPAAPAEPEPAATPEDPPAAPIAVAAVKDGPAPRPIAKATPAPRPVAARAVHARRAAAPAPTAPDPFEEVAPAAPRTPRKWVDPFAE